MSTELTKANELQTAFVAMSESHLRLRASDNPEFKKKFIKTFSDLIFSQNDEMLEKLAKTKPASLMNAVFKATEVGASFAKKEVSFIPFEIFKKDKTGGVEKKTATGEYEALVIFDINFQKQQILALENCKRFFTSEIYDGVKVLKSLETGNYIFEGENNVNNATVGYYAAFITSAGEKYDLFMSCAEIVERAKFSPQFKPENYKKTSNSVHYEKIVVRNLMKNIPKISDELSSVIAYDDTSEFTEYEEIKPETNRLEAAKKEIAQEQTPATNAQEPPTLTEPEPAKQTPVKEKKEPAVKQETATVKPDNFF
jgi:recombinational DNA repair protein RecT